MVTKKTSEAMGRSVRSASVGVLAWRSGDRPAACAVTPLLAADGRPVVASTLALIAKMRCIQADPRVALLAGGVFLRAEAELELDRTGAVFDGDLLRQEAAKFPPTQQLLAIPGHRGWLRWYFGRVIATLNPAAVIEDAGPDRAVLVTLRDGWPWVTALPDHENLLRGRPGDRLDLAGAGIDHGADGPAVILAHDESPAMTALAQLRISGDMRAGILHVRLRTGSLELPEPGTLAQLRDLRRLARKAAANADQLDRLDVVIKNAAAPTRASQASSIRTRIDQNKEL